jgi:hypothetical protein
VQVEVRREGGLGAKRRGSGCKKKGVWVQKEEEEIKLLGLIIFTIFQSTQHNTQHNTNRNIPTNPRCTDVHIHLSSYEIKWMALWFLTLIVLFSNSTQTDVLRNVM